MTEAALREFLATGGYKQSCDFRTKVLDRAISDLSDAPFTITRQTLSAALDRHTDFLCLQVKPKEDWTPRVTMDAKPLDPLLQIHLANLQRRRLNNHQNEPETTMLNNDFRVKQLATAEA